ncbi:arsenical pump-driving ATPase [Aeromonas schubertii]|uniref:Arsenical pump-driving ATPase n=1 Tax=Aeromonas schubertii TaxID=652 RepID=A0A0S2SEW5_9GAMM|nr:arsenical pump-driving ATPase [Aeromonas schubertii]ALP40247.1 arsenic ABC transporter ATPase [Aeromonas schubertii]
MSAFLHDAPPYLFFTGKGGVGKTSLACASAIALTGRGRRVLLVSTDPASNVAQVFETPIGNRITTIGVVPGLCALEIDPQAAARDYRERIVGPVRGRLPEAVVHRIEEQLSGACTTEIAAFDEFTALLTDPALRAEYDHILFDTAPTGHTLRLLQLPGAWSEFLEQGKGDASCLGPLAGLDKQRHRYRAAVEALCDRMQTRLVLVARAQGATLREVARTGKELAALGITHPHLVLNGLFPEAVIAGDPLAAALWRREQEALAQLPGDLATLPQSRLPLLDTNLVGVDALRALLAGQESGTSAAVEVASSPLPPLSSLVDSLEGEGHGLIMLMGKGGVGKTTLAAAVALELARRGHRVHLSTSDPAAHLSETLAEASQTLTVSRIDPEAETIRYREQVLASKGGGLDAAGRALLEEDLRSPCTAEIAVFQAFSRIIREAGRQFVVMDTAPTGHTLLLLDATGAYHREVARQMGSKGLHFTTPMMQLQDPARTKVLIVTLPEPTPVLEAAALQADLRRAGIEPWGWLVNQVLPDTVSAPLLRLRACAQRPQLAAVTAQSLRAASVPLQVVEPVGSAALLALTQP